MIKYANRRSCLLIIIFLVLAVSAIYGYCEEYKIETGDVVVVTVYEQPDLSTKARLDSAGEIAFPLIGNIQIGGLSVSEAVQKITALLEKDYLVNPQVNIFIEEYHPKKVFVMGFVNKPGEYELFKNRDTTVIEAITMAGGFKEGAAQNGTKVIRMENGEKVNIPIRVTDITNKDDRAQDISLKPGDIIVVPESFF
jgi:protein involved in polysaccharide export with SLBB domain